MRFLFAILLAVLQGCAAQMPPGTRTPSARPAERPPAERDQLRRIADAMGIVRDQYVDALQESMLAERCIKGMDGFLGARKPSPSAPLSGARPAERIGDYWRQVKQEGTEDRRALADACLRGMVDDLDRFTSYLGREEFRELQVGSTPLGGIGLELEIRDGVLTVVDPIEGAPAERMGLRRGDRLIALDGKPTAGLKLAEAVKLMRGKPGSTIVLGVERDGAAPMRIEGVRQVIRIQSVRTRQLEGGVLYVRISQFQEATLESFHKELAAGYAAAGASFRGIVLDLRGNTGGLFHTSIGVAAVFLPETAAVVETKGRAHDSSKRHLARPADYQRTKRDTGTDAKGLAEGLRKAPLVVLVDSRTAAGAEIVAAALQDHRRAQLIGEKTFGAGTVQTIIPLGESDALRLTTARFYRPEGQPIAERAVTPDVAVAHPERFRDYAAPADPALPTALKALLK